jgi:hypothetical protein
MPPRTGILTICPPEPREVPGTINLSESFLTRTLGTRDRV